MRLRHKKRRERFRAYHREALARLESLSEEYRHAYASLPRAPITVLCCPLANEINHGGILRTAESFRLERVIFSHEPDKAEDFSGHRGSVKWQPYEFATLDTGFEAQKDSFRVALTLNEHTQHFQDLEYKFPLTLVIGSELNGVPDYISGQCDAQIGIPMYGLMGSINVASAFAIAIQHITTEFAVQCSSFSPIRADAARLLYGS